VAGLATTLFLGGWRAPWPISVWAGANTGWWPVLWFLAKVFILLFCFIWLRGTLPRIRYDQLMSFGWKILIPASLAWILMIATIRVWRQHGGSTPVYIVGGAILVALLMLAWAGDVAAERRRAATAGAAEPAEGTAGPSAAAGEPDTGGPGFPVPPLDLPHYHGIGVTASPGGSQVEPDAVPRGTIKEVTGA
jgi:NADH-quinone oxidoreductase subunit H